jgi:hypothetical protein
MAEWVVLPFKTAVFSGEHYAVATNRPAMCLSLENFID